MNSYKLAIAAALLMSTAALTACGDTTQDRALSGAGIGAGVGAVGSAMTGGSPMTGAVLGGAVGAGVGAMTDKDQIDGGKPAWKR